jgi:hypothetical protein
MSDFKEQKSCRVCKNIKDIALFSKDSSKSDGLRSLCKPCDSKKATLWAKNNREKRKVTAKRASANYRKKNPKKVSEDNERFRQKNPDYAKEWAKANPEKVKMARNKHYQNNIPKTLERNRRRKVRILGNGFSPYTEQEVLEKYGTSCYLCNEEIDFSAPRWTKYSGWERGFHIEHVLDIALGGSDTLENVRPSHGLCNLRKNKGEKE